MVVDGKRCFALEKDDNVYDSRRLVFHDNGEATMKDFHSQVTIMTNFKIYIE